MNKLTARQLKQARAQLEKDKEKYALKIFNVLVLPTIKRHGWTLMTDCGRVGFIGSDGMAKDNKTIDELFEAIQQLHTSIDLYYVVACAQRNTTIEFGGYEYSAFNPKLES